jgi:hypothetical protein
MLIRKTIILILVIIGLVSINKINNWVTIPTAVVHS